MKPRVRTLLKRGIEAFGIVLIVFGVYAFQSRHLLPTDVQRSPALIAPTLSDLAFDLREHDAPVTLVYFFAPWCHICAASSNNIGHLRKLRSDDDLQILMVALDWKTRAEVQEYADRHELDGPILLGGPEVANDWNIYAFPTYYVIDNEQQIIHRDLGYSTLFGLWWRSM